MQKQRMAAGGGSPNTKMEEE